MKREGLQNLMKKVGMGDGGLMNLVDLLLNVVWEGEKGCIWCGRSWAG